MSEVPSRELRNDTRGVLCRVENGEAITITVDGRPVATLRPVPRRSRWMGRDDFLRRLAGRQADAGLTENLASLVPETTDDAGLV